MNNVQLIGRLTKKPEISYTPINQTANTKFTLAVDRPRKNGQDQGADFIRIAVWGKVAENCAQYLDKGRRVAITGRIQTGSYKNREGATVYTTDVIAERVEFLDYGNSNQNGYGDEANLPQEMQQSQAAPAQGAPAQATQPSGPAGTQIGFTEMPQGEDEPW